MSTETLTNNLYAALEAYAVDDFIGMLADDVQFNVVRSLPNQRKNGRAAVVDYLTKVQSWSASDGNIILERMAIDDDTAFTVHVEAKGTPREHRHVMIWRWADGKLAEVWELNLGGPPSLQGVDIAALERTGASLLVLESGG